MGFKDFTARQTAMLAGGIVGGYSSDVEDNFVGGIPAIGIGMYVGSQLTLPTSELLTKNPTEINMGPTVRSSLIDEGFQKYQEQQSNPKNGERLSSLAIREEKAKRYFERYAETEARIIAKGKESLEDLIKFRIGNDNVLDKSIKIAESSEQRQIKELDRIIKRDMYNTSKRLSSGRETRERNYKYRYIDNRGLTPVIDRYADTLVKTKVLSPKLNKEERRKAVTERFINSPTMTKHKQRISNNLNRTKDLYQNMYDEVTGERKQINEEYREKEVQRITKEKEELIEKLKARREEQLEEVRNSNLYKMTSDRTEKALINLRKSKQSRLEAKERAESYTKRISAVTDVLKSYGIKFDENDAKDIRKVIDNIDNPQIHKQIEGALNSEYTKNVDLIGVKADQIYSKYQTVKNDDIESLTKWFHEELGNTPELAKEKAEMFSNRSEKGSSILLNDGRINFKDRVSGEYTDMPLTSYTGDGKRFHYAGSGTYNTVTQFNPLALAYKEGIQVDLDGTGPKTITAKDVMKGYDPEMWLKYYGDNVSAKDIAREVEKLFHYNSGEAAQGELELGSGYSSSSAASRNSQGIIEFGRAINYNKKGAINEEYGVRKLRLNATETEASERVSFLSKLVDETNDPNLSNNVATNSLTTFNSNGKGYVGFAAPVERNPTDVGNRDTLVSNNNESTTLLKSILGEDRYNEQFSSSQVLHKLDVVDDTAFNEISSRLFGADSVLGDGSGLYNRELGQDLNNTGRVTFKLNTTQDTLIHHEGLAEALSQPTVEATNKYLKDNPVILSNEAFATNGDFSVGLKRHFNSATIDNITRIGDNLVLGANATFDANMENNAKYFSLGSKLLLTGEDGDTFKLQTALGTGLNRGDITNNSDGSVTIKGKTYTGNDDIRQGLQDYHNTDIHNGGNLHLISTAGDTGVKDIMEAINTANNHSDPNYILHNDPVFNQLIKENFSPETSAMTSMLFVEGKASVDSNISAMLRIGSNSDNKESINNIFNTDTYNKLSIEDRNKLHSNLAEEIDRSGIISNYREGISSTIGSVNKGSSIVGTGNRAGMSWIAMKSLIQSGTSKEQLGIFGKANEELLYEVKGHVTEQYKSKNAVNDAISGRESTFLNIINTEVDPSLRMQLLKENFAKGAFDSIEDHPYITYNLSKAFGDIQSLNFSRINTNRSGFFKTPDGMKMLKDLDRRKAEVVQADLEYKTASKKNTKDRKEEELRRSVERYQEAVKVAYSGDNNLAKKAIALVSEKSSIMQVKYVGGKEAEFADRSRLGTLKQRTDPKAAKEASKQVWFASEAELERRAKQAGVKLQFTNVEGYDGVRMAVTEAANGDMIPFTSLLTREPAQGPLSSDLVHWATSDRIKDRTENKDTLHNAYTTINNTMYSIGASGDGDQDTLQTLTANFTSKAEYEAFERDREEVRSVFLEVEPLLKQMSAKSSKKKVIRSIAPMDISDTAAYNTAGAIKGRNRKTLAAKATELATSFNEELTMSLGSDKSKNREVLKARMAIYQVVENLIKSSHLETNQFLNISQQPVERMIQLRNQYIGKDTDKGMITESQYRKELHSILEPFLNIDEIKKGSFTAGQKRDAGSMVDLIVESSANHAKVLKDKSYSPLDLAESRLKNSYGVHMDNIAAIMGYASVSEVDYAPYSEDIGKAVKQTYNSTKDVIMDTLRNNKMKIGGGLAAMGAVALMTRSQPDFEKPQREHSSKMLIAPQRNLSDYIPNGIETNPNKTAHMMPKSFQGKNVHAQYQNTDDNPFTDFA